jgi:hypothetical protein
MKSWIENKPVPGQFTGSTGAKVLSPAELNSRQVWARKVTKFKPKSISLRTLS